MAMTAADVLVETMLPGDGINGIVESLRRQQARIRFIQVRHEEAAAFMACAWAKFTGMLGASIATSGACHHRGVARIAMPVDLQDQKLA